MKANRWITNNLGLKLVALFLAVVTWFYVSAELAKLKDEEERAVISMMQYDVILKRLPIQLTIMGEAREGYELTADGITVDPETIVVVGPEKILEEVDIVRTVPIDISEYTKDVKTQLSLAPIARGLVLKDSVVNVYIPILKKEEKSPDNEVRH